MKIHAQVCECPITPVQMDPGAQFEKIQKSFRRRRDTPVETASQTGMDEASCGASRPDTPRDALAGDQARGRTCQMVGESCRERHQGRREQCHEKKQGESDEVAWAWHGSG